MTDSDYFHTPIPFREPFVLFGWGDSQGDQAQTCTIVLPDTAQEGIFNPGGTPIQRRISAMRLRYVADLVDPDKEEE